MRNVMRNAPTEIAVLIAITVKDILRQQLLCSLVEKILPETNYTL